MHARGDRDLQSHHLEVEGGGQWRLVGIKLLVSLSAMTGHGWAGSTLSQAAIQACSDFWYQYRPWFHTNELRLKPGCRPRRSLQAAGARGAGHQSRHLKLLDLQLSLHIYLIHLDLVTIDRYIYIVRLTNCFRVHSISLTPLLQNARQLLYVWYKWRRWGH